MNTRTHQRKQHGLAKNSLINLLGLALPLSVGVIALPAIVDGFGTERFGLLTIIWMVIGYFNLLDVGMSRSMTKYVAEYLAGERRDETRSLVFSGLVTMLVLSVIGAVIVVLVSPYLVSNVFRISPELRAEAEAALLILAVSVPFVVLSLGLRGILQAAQRFDYVNYVRVPVGLNTFIAPLVAVHYSDSLVPAVAALGVGRIVTFGAYWFLVRRCLPPSRDYRFDTEYSWLLLRTGGWITVSNLLSPVLVYADRFIIGAVLTMTSVAYYATPFEVVTKVLLISTAIVAVLFPAFSARQVSSIEASSFIYKKGMRQIYLLIFPALLPVALFASEILNLWLGPDFASNGYRPLQLLCLGVLFNGLAGVPFAYIQGTGKARVAATVHAIEVPVFLVIMFMLVSRLGIIGAALAWSIRVMADALILHIVSARNLQIAVLPWRHTVCSGGPVLLAAALVWSGPAQTWRIAGLIVLLAFHLVAHKSDVGDAVGALVHRRPRDRSDAL